MCGMSGKYELKVHQFFTQYTYKLLTWSTTSIKNSENWTASFLSNQREAGIAYILDNLDAAPLVTFATRSWESSFFNSSSCFRSSSFFLVRRSRQRTLACGGKIVVI